MRPVVHRLAFLVAIAAAFSAFALAAADWAQYRQQIEAALYVPQPLPDLRAKSYGDFAAATDVTAERVSYATAYGLHVPRDCLPATRSLFVEAARLDRCEWTWR